MRYSIYILTFLAGIFSDVALVGGLKLIWSIIYVPTYLTVALTLNTRWLKQLSNDRKAHLLTALYLIGAFGAHWAFNNVHIQRSYELKLIAVSPITLGSDDWPQRLYVTSVPLQNTLSATPQAALPNSSHAVSLTQTTNYGCIQKSIVTAVDGIDLINDKASNWVWKTENRIPWTNVGPGFEDRPLIWCRFSVLHLLEKIYE